MIFYFSGTGNSKHAAKEIAKVQGEEIVDIAQEMQRGLDELSYELKENEKLGFVFPVHAWGPPDILIRFIKKIKIIGSKPYIFSVVTCGEEEGRTSKILEKQLLASGLSLDSSFSIVMPNNYILGYDIDSQELQKKKLSNTIQKIDHINEILSNSEKGITNTIPGRFPSIKSSIINPMFKKSLNVTKSYYALDTCTKCGLCVDICPVGSISLDDKPAWQDSCIKCFGCINRCPVQAIQFGKGTEKKRRYFHPDLIV
jgi:NAD-dependent dihydropyrimidine dehydrogenase PreA subunit/flavodoxin